MIFNFSYVYFSSTDHFQFPVEYLIFVVSIFFVD